MPRPVGAPFWGESLPPADAAVLSGSANYVEADGTTTVGSSVAPFAATTWGEGDGLSSDEYARVPSAAKLLWIFGSDATYLESGDAADISWIVRARGSGSFTVTNDRDTSWSYSDPAGASIGSQTVTASWVAYEFPTSEYTVADILDGDGGYRLAVDVTGLVDIDVVQLRIWPPGGALGGWSSTQLPEDHNILLSTTRMEVSDSEVESSVASTAQSPAYEADSDTAHGTMLAEASGDMSEESASVSTGRGTLHATAEDDVLSNLSGTIHQYKWHYDTSYLLCEVPNVDEEVPGGYAGGTEGVDYIRRPDRTYADKRDYWDWSSGARPEVTGWLNNVGHLTGTLASTGAAWDWDDVVPDPAVSVVFDDWTAPPGSLFTWRPASYAFPPTMGAPIVLPTTGSEDDYIDLDLPISDRFAMFMANTVVFNSPPERDLSGQVMAGQASFSLTASLELGGAETAEKVYGIVTVPGYRYWSPTAAAQVSWVRNVQRNDGLGVSPWRWGSNTKVNVRVVGITFSGFGSNQSIRWRGTR